jgi:hypothetical protein
MSASDRGSQGLYHPARGYRREAAKRAIRELYPDGIAVSADERDDAVNGWLVSHSFPKVSRKTIQRALEDLDSEAPAQ